MMMNKKLTPQEIAELLAKSKKHKFREKSQTQIDGINKLSSGNKYRAQTDEGKAKIKKRNASMTYKRNHKEAVRRLAQDTEWLEKNRQQHEKLSNDPEWQKQNAEKWRAVAKDKDIQKKRIKNLKKAMQDPEVQRRKLQSFKQTMQTPGGKDNIISAAQKRSKDPEWIKNHQKIQTMKSTDPKYQGFRDRMKQIAKEKGTKCQVKEPNSEWVTFDTFGEAARHYNWNNLSSSPKGCFPQDGSIKQWSQKLRKGWQTRRVINE